MTVRLYHGNISTCSQKVRLALAEKGVSFDSVVLNLRAGDQYEPGYRKLNPGAVVPTLVNGADVIIESTVINEYIDESFAGPPLKPASPGERAAMRCWTKQLDESLHGAVVVLSFCIAFRHDFLSKTEAEMAAFYQRMNNPDKERFYREAIARGMDHSGFIPAVRRYRKLLQDMESALNGREWLAGAAFSLADIALIPYLTRLEHLGLAGMWADKPNVTAWHTRARQRPGYQTAVTDWLVAPAVSAMNATGKVAWPQVREILAGWS